MEKFRRMDQQAEKDTKERVRELGRRTREEIAKWNQMTAVRFQTGGGGGERDISQPRPPFGVSSEVICTSLMNGNRYVTPASVQVCVCAEDRGGGGGGGLNSILWVKSSECELIPHDHSRLHRPTACFARARRHLERTRKQRSKVLYTDESRFILSFNDGRIRV